MVRLFSEGRDCSGLLAAAAGGWLALWWMSAAHVHHGDAPSSYLLHGAAMACVMLYPVLVEPARHVRRSSFPAAKPRHLFLFVSAYAAIWAAFGTLAAAMAASIPAGFSALAFAAALAGAWLWQGSETRRAAAGQCHATWAIYGDGLEGLGSTAMYGVRIGAACLLACGPLMLAAMLSPRPLAGMLFALILIVRERFGPDFVVRQNAAIVGIGTLVAMIYAGLGV